MTPIRAWIFGILIAASVGAGVWRFVDLSRDPDVVTETSQDSWGDPSFYLYNARSYALFGEWRPHESLSLYVTPGYAFLSALWFSLFGVSYGAAVIQATLAGFMMIAATAYAAECAARVDDEIPRHYALAAAAVSLLISYVLFALQRVPNGDMESFAAVSLAAAGLSRLQILDLKKQGWAFRRTALLAGFAAGIAPFMKLHTGLFSAACGIAWIASYFFLDHDEWRMRWRTATPALIAGLAAAALVWLGWVVWLYRTGLSGEIFRQANSLRVFSIWTARPENPYYHASARFEITKFFQSNLFYRQPIETLLATLGLTGFLTGRRRNWPLFLASVWLLTGIAALTGMTVSPLRYRLIFWPPIVILGAHFWARLSAGKIPSVSGRRLQVATIGTGLSLAGVSAYFVSVRMHFRNVDAVALVLLAFSIAAALVIWKAFSKVQPRNIALISACGLLLVAAPQWINGERSVSHELLQASNRLDQYPNGVLGGGWGVRLGFSSRRNAYFEWTPEAAQRVTLLVEDPASDYFKNVTLPWRELERQTMHRLPLTIVFVEVIR